MRCIILSKSSKSWFVYIVECSDKTLYIGMSNDVDKRIKAHNTTNASRYTRARRPVILRYFESCKNKSFALKKEIKFKKYSRKKKLALIEKFDKDLLKRNTPSAKHR